jgi:hypothetical protein
MDQNGKKDLKQEANAYLKYSGLGLQLLITILASGWIGYKIDQYFAFKFPVFMLLLGFGAFGGTMFQLYRKLKKE